MYAFYRLFTNQINILNFISNMQMLNFPVKCVFNV